MNEWFPAAARRHPFGLRGSREFLLEANPKLERRVLLKRPPGISAQVIGTAIDYRIRLCLAAGSPQELMTLQGVRFSAGMSGFAEFLGEFADFLIRVAPTLQRLPRGTEDLLNRYCYVLASFSCADPHGALRLVASNWQLSAEDHFEAVPDAALNDMRAISWLFWDSSQPILDLVMRHGMPVLCGPRFGVGGTMIGGAVADFILGGHEWGSGAVIDIKACATSRLARSHLMQVVGYTLLDWEDAYSIQNVGFYLARSGDWTMWDASELLNYLADRARLIGVKGRRELSLAEWRVMFRETVADEAYESKQKERVPVIRQGKALARARRVKDGALTEEPCALCAGTCSGGWDAPLTRRGTLLCDRCFRLAKQLNDEGRPVIGLNW